MVGRRMNIVLITIIQRALYLYRNLLGVTQSLNSVDSRRIGPVCSCHDNQHIVTLTMASPSTYSFDIARAKLPPDTVAIVTGAAEGLGKGFAEGLLDKGAKGVCIADVNEPLGLKTAQELSDRFGRDRVIFVKCDVASAAQVEAVFAKAKERFGAINLVVNNAGLCNEKEIEQTINVNVTGVAYGTYTAIKYMSPAEGGTGGKIINIASVAGFHPFEIVPVYTASKFAVVGLTRSLMADPRLKEKGITFGALCPSLVDTRLLEKLVLRHPEGDQKKFDDNSQIMGKMDVSTIRDAFLRLVLDDSWCGKVMAVDRSQGIFDPLAQ
ncbi:15-hydroxyprostaglandin dehydrogenase [NAD(+)]-like [Patiria miniata]|uniref:15-hydroxyprostaglandin dehydrogenase [NAD(+)] n=1 Tax=Patiria miniata TaxID=46514 RepID=A0A913Z077_PATMI|nr:15-hydroxyprostaglandin dehydrogenase [NAD(+)]-like [Patiria miniata]